MKRTAAIIVFMFLLCISMISCKSKAKRMASAKEVLNKRCNKCHFSDKIYQKKYTKGDWENIVNRMVAYSKEKPKSQGILIPGDEAEEILYYLHEESGE